MYEFDLDTIEYTHISEEEVLTQWSKYFDYGGILCEYVDIPFCYKICSYCVHRGDLATINSPILIEYTDKVVKQIKLFRNSMKEKAKSIYFGGGTPSLLSTHSMDKIVCALGGLDQYRYSNIEINPMTLTKEKLKYLSELKFKYVSLGVQTFNRNDLKTCNRDFSLTKLKEAIKSFQEQGSAVNIDLMQHIVRVDDGSQLTDDLVEAMSLDVDFITVYGTYDKYRLSGYSNKDNVDHDRNMKSEIKYGFYSALDEGDFYYDLIKCNLDTATDDTLIAKSGGINIQSVKAYSCSNPPQHDKNQSVLPYGSIASRKAFGYIGNKDFVYDTWIEGDKHLYRKIEIPGGNV